MAGMVCMKSRTGRVTALTVLERDAQMPSGTASTSAMMVATSTRVRVSIASSHSSTESMTAKPTKASTPASRPRSHQAMTATMPAKSSGAGAERTAAMPSNMLLTMELIASNSQARWVWSQSTAESTQSPRGSLNTGHLLRDGRAGPDVLRGLGGVIGSPRTASSRARGTTPMSLPSASVTATATPLCEQGVNSSMIGVDSVTVAGAAASTSAAVRSSLPSSVLVPMTVCGSAMMAPAVSTRVRSTSWVKEAT